MYSKGYNGHWNTRIGHMSSGKELFGVLNAPWRRVIQDSKCGYFDNNPKIGWKTALHQNERAKGFPWWFGVVFWGRNRGTFCPLIVKSVNKGVYIKLLESLLLPVINRVQDTLGDSIFQQDNAPVYKAAVVMDFLRNTTSRWKTGHPIPQTTTLSNMSG